MVAQNTPFLPLRAIVKSEVFTSWQAALSALQFPSLSFILQAATHHVNVVPEFGCFRAILPANVGLLYVICRLNENWNGRSTHAAPASQSDRQVGSLHKLAGSIVRLQFPSLSFILQDATFSSESWPHQEFGCQRAILPAHLGLLYVLCCLNENWNGCSTHAVPASQSDRQVGSLHKLAGSIVSTPIPVFKFHPAGRNKSRESCPRVWVFSRTTPSQCRTAVCNLPFVPLRAIVKSEVFTSWQAALSDSNSRLQFSSCGTQLFHLNLGPTKSLGVIVQHSQAVLFLPSKRKLEWSLNTRRFCLSERSSSQKSSQAGRQHCQHSNSRLQASSCRPQQIIRILAPRVWVSLCNTPRQCWTAVCFLPSKRKLEWSLNTRRSCLSERSSSRKSSQAGRQHCQTPIPVFKFHPAGRNKSRESWPHQEFGCQRAILPAHLGLLYVLCCLNENWNGRSTHAVPASQSDRQVGSLHKLAGSIVSTPIPVFKFHPAGRNKSRESCPRVWVFSRTTPSQCWTAVCNLPLVPLRAIVKSEVFTSWQAALSDSNSRL